MTNRIPLFKIAAAVPPDYIRGVSHKYFNFQYYTANVNDFAELAGRWRGREHFLQNLFIEIMRDKHDWCGALRPYDEPPLAHLSPSRGGYSSEHGVKSYNRDLRGLCIENLNASDSLNGLDWAFLDFCEFKSCNLLMPEKGKMLFFFSDLSHCKFTSCAFRNGRFFEGTMKNTVFYDCTFENVEFNANGKDKSDYTNILFINCRFKNVNLSRVDLRNVCFTGNCHFNKIIIDDEDLMKFDAVAANFLKTFRLWDSQDWHIRKNIQSVTYAGLKAPVINMCSKGTAKPYGHKLASLQSSVTGLIAFYEHISTTCDNHTKREVFSRTHYVLCWLIDQKRILASPLKGRVRAIPGRYVTGYGDRPGTPIFAWMASVLLFAVLSGITGIRTGNCDNTFTSTLATGNFEDLVFFVLQCIYFSVITATTVGYGDISPSPGLTMLFSASNAAIGMFLFTTFTVVMARRLLR